MSKYLFIPPCVPTFLVFKSKSPAPLLTYKCLVFDLKNVSDLSYFLPLWADLKLDWQTSWKLGRLIIFQEFHLEGGQKFVMVEFWFSVRKFNNNYQIFLAYLKIFLRNQITRRSSKWFKTTGFEQKKLVLHLFPLGEKVNQVQNNHQFHMRHSAL